MVGKYALTCTMEIQKIHMVVHIFSGFALFTELMWVYRGVESLCKLLTDNKVPFDQFTDKRVQIQILSILKLVSFASLAGNDFSERGTQAKAHCERNPNRQLWSIRRKISHRCLRNFQCRHYYKSCWLFAFAFCKRYARKTGVLARWLFAFVLRIYVLKIGGNCRGKY